MHSRLNRCSFSLVAASLVGALVLTPVAAQAAGTDLIEVRPASTSPAPVNDAAIPEEVAVEQTAVKVDPATPGAAAIKRTEVEPFRMAGVTWDASASAKDVTVRVQVRTNGSWGAWETLEAEESIEGGRPGTVPLWTAQAADGIAVDVQAAAGTPTGVKVTTIDPGQPETVTSARSAAFTAEDEEETETVAADGTPTVVPMPTIITRKQWGAGPGTSCDSPTTQPKALGVVVHHTAGSNTYTKAESAGLVRGYQSYHVKGHGWCDIGYNFLVDRFGQVFEGRKGGMLNQVRAAHSGVDAVNQWATGVSMMGHFEKSAPSEEMKSAMVKLLGWRLAYFKANPKGTYTVGGKKYQVINGHRDVKSTACPGAIAYAWINSVGGLRDRVAAYTAKATSAAGAPVAVPVVYTAPSSFKVSARAKTSLSFQWASQAKAPGYRLSIVKLGSTTGTRYFFTTKNSLKVTKLKKGTRYQVQVAVADPKARKRLGPLTPAPYLIGITVGYKPATAPSPAPTTAPAAVNTVTVPAGGSVSFRGHGYGHGIGMSQYGAEGGARAGYKFDAILAKYYPGTKLETKAGVIRVNLTADTSNSVNVKHTAGLKIRNLSNNVVTALPAKVGSLSVTNWSIDTAKANKAHNSLYYQSGSKWYTFATFNANAQFEGPTTINLVLPNGSLRAYRGALRSAVPKAGSTTRDTINVLSLEDYLRGVVPREMPATWSIEALKAQSVAARTYASRYLGSTKHFDICDTTSCQVYGGFAAEATKSNQAVDGTKGKILTHGGKPAFTQFSSSSGGYTNKGSFAYLSAVSDPWDSWSGNKNYSWTIKVSAKTIAAKYPSVGTLRTLTVTKRNGLGQSGGRVLSLTIKGSKGSKTITGVDARWAFGLRSDWFGF
ncbi:MAG TPA: SpoIID/LytB domain-containing protein [Aeromicrobium sp.]|nr:SpoIID/LytB domain-containing protein [Aeromicrobium sp.]